MESTAKSNNQRISNNRKILNHMGREHIEIGVNIYSTNYQKDLKNIFTPQILYQCVC